MIEFNPDGSIKMPDKLAKQKEDSANKMTKTRCMQIRKEIVSDRTPKSCALHLTLSDKITDRRFVENIYAEFNRQSEVTSKFMVLSEKEFKIEIGTSFRRCSDCSALISRYREFLRSNLIELQGSCTFQQRRSANFCYEDHFG